MIEDYLSILDSLVTIAGLLDGQIDKKIEEIPTDFTDGSIPFADSSLLIEDNSNLFWDYVNKSLLVGPDTDINCTFGRLKVGYMDDITFADIAYIAHYDQFAWNTFALAQLATGAVTLNGNGSVNFHDKMLTYGRYYNSGGIDKRWHISGGLGDPVAFCLGGGLGSERVFFRQTGTSPTQLNLTTPYSNLQFNVDGQIGVGIVPPTSKLHVAGSIASAITTKTADYTATIEDSTIVIDASSNTVTITLPTAVGIDGRKYNIKCIDDTFACDVDGDGTETIDGELTQILNQWDNMQIQSDGTNWIIL